MALDPSPDERIVRRIRSEYLEMPGLRLTQPQAQRLWGLDEDTCVAVLRCLVDARFLMQAGGGAYARLSDEAMPRKS